MAIKNHQYDQLRRAYEDRQRQNQAIQKRHYEHAYELIPDLATLDASVSSLASRMALASLNDNVDATDSLRQEITACANRRHELLISHGLPADYLEPVYTCPDCKDTGYIHNERCHCFTQAIVELLYEQSNIHSMPEKDTFEHFCLDYYSDEGKDSATGCSPRVNIEHVLTVCKRFMDQINVEHGNLLFYGNTGVGKTFLSNCIARELLNRSHTVVYLTAFQLFDILEKNKFHRDTDTSANQQLVDYMLTCELLVLDDLGTELTNTFTSAQLFYVMNERLIAGLSTIISTNLSFDDLSRRYSERIFSRLTGNYTLLKITGDDIRLKKKITN